MRLGIFGGTFDPPHVGHFIAAQEIHHRMGLDRLVLVPAAVPPHKRDERVTAGEVRLEMLRAAVGGDDRFEVSDVELERDGPSYTIDTLRTLRDRHPAADLFVAIGADQLVAFDSWKDPDGIAELATLVAFPRSGRSPETDGPWPVEVVEVPELDISSTKLRERVAAGQPIRYWVAGAVEAVIRREGLYTAARRHGGTEDP